MTFSSSSLKYLIQTYESMCEKSVPLILATVVETLGSTYRKAGARILIAQDGQFYGIIAGGCFDGDLREQTKAIFESGETRELFYDMRAPEDALWGLGLGCNGAVRLFLQPLQMDGQDDTMRQLANIANSLQDQVFATYCSGSLAGHSRTINPNGSLDLGSEEHALHNLWQTSLTEAKPKAQFVTQADGIQVFLDYIPAQKHLVLIGAGADAGPIIQFAAQVNWRISLIDYRPAYLDAARFPGVTTVANVTPNQLVDRFANERVDAVVLMTHNIDYDSQYIKHLNQLSCAYIGLLGPKQRAEELFKRSGLTESDFGDRLHAPVGLDIGRSNTPESIALSLIAEIHACLHQGNGGFIKDNLSG